MHDHPGVRNAEAGVLPREAEIAAMGRYNEELVKAGVLLTGEDSQALAASARVRFSSGNGTVTDGPFSETKQLIAGFWLIQVKSKGRGGCVGHGLSHPGRRDRDSPGPRGRGLRCRVHPGVSASKRSGCAGQLGSEQR